MKLSKALDVSHAVLEIMDIFKNIQSHKNDSGMAKHAYKSKNRNL